MKDWFSRWWIAILIVILLSFGWVLLEGLYHKEKLYNLSFEKYIVYIFKGLLEIWMFLIAMKLIFSTNAVLDSMKDIFINIITKKDFLEKMKRRELLKFTNEIHKVDDTIQINDDLTYIKAVENTISDWKKYEGEVDSKNYIILESTSTNTLYNSGLVIYHKKFKIRMMKRGKFEDTFAFMPFDENVQNSIEDEKYLQDSPGDRWEGRAFKCYPIGSTVKSMNVTREISLDQNNSKDTRNWAIFHFETELLECNHEFIFEISISDVIKRDDSKQSKERRNTYFQDSFNGKLHAIRRIIFQLESYPDTATCCLPFEPRITIDGYEETRLDNCVESIYYRRWFWEKLNDRTDEGQILYKLAEIDGKADCSA